MFYVCVLCFALRWLHVCCLLLLRMMCCAFLVARCVLLVVCGLSCVRFGLMLVGCRLSVVVVARVCDAFVFLFVC